MYAYVYTNHEQSNLEFMSLPPNKKFKTCSFSVGQGSRQWSQLIHSFMKEFRNYVWFVPVFFWTDPNESVHRHPAKWTSEPLKSFCKFRNCGSNMISGYFFVSRSAIEDLQFFIFSDPTPCNLDSKTNMVSRKAKNTNPVTISWWLQEEMEEALQKQMEIRISDCERVSSQGLVFGAVISWFVLVVMFKIMDLNLSEMWMDLMNWALKPKKCGNTASKKRNWVYSAMEEHSIRGQSPLRISWIGKFLDSPGKRLHPWHLHKSPMVAVVGMAVLVVANFRIASTSTTVPPRLRGNDRAVGKFCWCSSATWMQ